MTIVFSKKQEFSLFSALFPVNVPPPFRKRTISPKTAYPLGQKTYPALFCSGRLRLLIDEDLAAVNRRAQLVEFLLIAGHDAHGTVGVQVVGHVLHRIAVGSKFLQRPGEELGVVTNFVEAHAAKNSTSSSAAVRLQIAAKAKPSSCTF